MKKSKGIILAAIILPTLICGGTIAGVLAATINNQDLSNNIYATSHCNNKEVNILPGNVDEFWNYENLYNHYNDYLKRIDNLYSYNSELESFSSVWSSDSAVKAIYDKYDSYKPVNNILSWKTKVEADSFNVIISRDSKFKTYERMYTVGGDATSVEFENPYTGTTYYWMVEAVKGESVTRSNIFSFKTKATTRTVDIPGVSNTRDWGGYEGKDGVRTKQGLIYRGARLDNIANEGKSEVQDNLKIKTDLDLRAAGEGKTNPAEVVQTFNYSCPYYMGSTGLDTTDETYLTNLGNAIKTFANKDNYPIYFHCSVGRDRTGAVSMILNLLAGVSVEDTMKEFLTSVFSVTGAWSKGSTGFYNNFHNYINYFDTFEGKDYSEKVANYLINRCHVTSEEISTVQSILLGETEVDVKTQKAYENGFDGYHQVTLKEYGQETRVMMVENGKSIPTPTSRCEGKWYFNDQVWNFENPVTEDMVLIFKADEKVTIYLNAVGYVLSETSIEVDKSEIIYPNQKFAIEGFKLKTLDQNGQFVESLYADDDLYLNLIYTKK